jgi:acetylglutamate kinase
VVVKIGGSVGQGETSQGMESAFAADIALLRSVGLNVVVVHGGGPQISQLADRLGLRSEFVDGRRVTDAAMLEAVRYVLLGQVNPHLVGLITQAGARAAGLAGTDAQLITERPADPALGYVGEVERVDPEVLRPLLARGLVPVVATVARGDDGQDYNVNADTVAEAIAVSLKAHKLIYMTGVPGVLRDRNDPSSLVTFADPDDLQELMTSGALAGGMRPKVEACIRAATSGVERTHIIDGRAPDALLLEVFTGSGTGTMIVGRKEKATYLGVDLAD